MNVFSCRWRMSRLAAVAVMVFSSGLVAAVGFTANGVPAGGEREKQIAEQEANCRANTLTATFTDCACVARKMFDLATAAGRTPEIQVFAEEAQLACPQQDRQVVAKYIFQSCDSFMVSVRTDHEQYCNCTADDFVKRYYALEPPTMRRWMKLRRDAMQACGLADQSTRVVTSTPVSAAEAASGCVKFYSNEKKILENAEQNKRFGHEAKLSPDVVLVNECSHTIRLNTPIAYAVPRPADAPQECAIKRIFPGWKEEVRSQSRVARSGLDARVPTRPLSVCLGDVTEGGTNRYKSDCSCGTFQRVEVPLSDTLKPLP